MSLLLLLLLVLPLSNCESSKETVKDDLVETMYKSEKLNGIEDKVEELEKKLETKNVEVENLHRRLTEMEMQFESRIDDLMLSTQTKNQNQDVASLKSEVRAEVKKEVEQVLPSAVEQGLRDLPYEMVCAYQDYWGNWENDTVSYDQITVEFNNSDQQGGADGTMNIETGVFTTVTSGYYIITFSAYAKVKIFSGTVMSLYHNGVEVEESGYQMFLWAGGSAEDFIWDQGSRSVVRE